MKKYIFTKCLMLFLVMGFIPSIARAANVYLETSRNTVSAGDTFIIRVKIDAENKDTNSVEGDIVLQAQNNNFVVNDFSLAKFPFTASGLTVRVVPSGTGSAERDEWADLVSQDKEDPSLLLITLGREPSLFEGKIFAFFTAID